MVASSVLEMFLQYIDNNYLLGGLFVISLIYYVCKAFRTKKRLGTTALIAALFPLVTVFNPPLFKYLIIISDEEASYYRFIWALPLVPLSACFLAEIISGLYHATSRLLSSGNIFSKHHPFAAKAHAQLASAVSTLTALVLCAAIVFSGTSYLTKNNLTMPENKFTISRAALDISQFIHDDPDYDGESVVLAPTQIMMELEAYDITLAPALPRSEYLSYGSGASQYEPLLSVVLEGAQRNTEYMIWNLYSLDVDYIVCLTLFGLDPYMESIDYDVYNRTGDYTLYKRADDAHPFY